MQMRVQVSVSPALLRKMNKLGQVATTKTPEMRRAYTRAAMVYRRFLERRWLRLSRGGGEWPDRVDNKPHPILIKTGTLIREVSQNRRKGRIKLVRNGVVVGFSRRRHPEAKMPISRLASIHQEGKGRVPVRRVMVPPPRGVRRRMVAELNKGVRKIINE